MPPASRVSQGPLSTPLIPHSWGKIMKLRDTLKHPAAFCCTVPAQARRGASYAPRAPPVPEWSLIHIYFEAHPHTTYPFLNLANSLCRKVAR